MLPVSYALPSSNVQPKIQLLCGTSYFCPNMLCISEVLFEQHTLSFPVLHCYLPFPINLISLHRFKAPCKRSSILHLLERQLIIDQQCHQTAEFKSKDFILNLSILWISIRISMQYELSIALRVIILYSALQKIYTPEQVMFPLIMRLPHSQRLYFN